MVKRRIGITAFVVCLCLCLLPCVAYAASTADASESVDIMRNCSMTLYYRCEETAFADIPVALYKIADVSADFRFTLTSSFADSRIDLNSVQTSGEWQAIRSTLDTYIFANGIESDITGITDREGILRLDGLETGMYLILSQEVVLDDVRYFFDSALISLPDVDDDGNLLYDVTVTNKFEILPPVNPDEDIDFKVFKLWKGDSGSQQRPIHVVVDIFRNDDLYQSVILSSDNNWTYGWAAKDDGSVWRVVEKDVPKGYVATVEERDGSFVVTNTFPTPETPDTPQTGDSSNMLVYVLMMIASGILLVVISRKGKSRAL